MDNTGDISARYLNDLRKGRGNLLAMTGLTVVNIVLLFIDETLNFPFSSFGPQFAVALGLELKNGYGLPAFLPIGIAAAALMVAFYYFSALLSAKRPGWFIAALAAFVLDTALLLVLTLPDFDASLFIDIAFHFWVLYYLIRAVVARGKLKQLAEQPAPVESAEFALTAEGNTAADAEQYDFAQYAEQPQAIEEQGDFKPRFPARLPENWKTFFDPRSDDALKRKNPRKFMRIQLIGVAALCAPMILYLYLTLAVFAVPDSAWILTGLAGAFGFGIGLFNIVSAYVGQYMGHKVTAISLIGGVLLQIGSVVLMLA